MYHITEHLQVSPAGELLFSYLRTEPRLSMLFRIEDFGFMFC
jgi:hypothetical protein